MFHYEPDNCAAFARQPITSIIQRLDSQCPSRADVVLSLSSSFTPARPEQAPLRVGKFLISGCGDQESAHAYPSGNSAFIEGKSELWPTFPGCWTADCWRKHVMLVDTHGRSCPGWMPLLREPGMCREAVLVDIVPTDSLICENMCLRLQATTCLGVCQTLFVDAA